MTKKFVLLLSLLCLLPGCDSSSTTTGNDPEGGGSLPLDLCVNSDCGEKTVLLDLPSAENLIFSPDGRLFVSAGLGVFEIKRDAAGAFSATPIAPDCGARSRPSGP